MREYITREGLEKLKMELGHLSDVKRKEIAERLEKCLAFGDLIENAEYHETKEEQAFIEGRILELEHTLKVAEVADAAGSKTASVGSEIVLEKNGAPLKISLVGATEADPANGKISIDSPLGKALLGKAVKDQFELQTPNGLSVYKVVTLK